MKKLQRGINKEKIDDKRKINARKRKILLELLEPYEERLKMKKRIIVVLDSYIELIPLPPYSPKLNPIEQVWRTERKAKLIFLRKNILILKIKAFSNGFDFKIWSFVHLSNYKKNELSTDFIKNEQYLIDNFKTNLS